MPSQQNQTEIVGNSPLEVKLDDLILFQRGFKVPLFLLRSVEGAAEASGGLKGKPDDEFESSEFGW